MGKAEWEKAEYINVKTLNLGKTGRIYHQKKYINVKTLNLGKTGRMNIPSKKYINVKTLSFETERMTTRE